MTRACFRLSWERVATAFAVLLRLKSREAIVKLFTTFCVTEAAVRALFGDTPMMALY